jgi:hypothetical protein
MKAPLDDQIDQALYGLPVWTPPDDFTRRVLPRAVIPDVRPDAPGAWFWVGATLQGATAAIVAYVGSAIVSGGATLIVLSAASVVEDYVEVVRSLFSRI